MIYKLKLLFFYYGLFSLVCESEECTTNPYVCKTFHFTEKQYSTFYIYIYIYNKDSTF